MLPSPARKKRARERASFSTMKSPIERLLEGVFRIGRYRAWWVVIVWLLATGFGVYYSLDIPFRGSFLDLLPRNDPLIDEYRENERYFGDAVGLLVELVEEVPDLDEERDARLVHGAEALAARCASNAVTSHQLSSSPPNCSVCRETRRAGEATSRSPITWRTFARALRRLVRADRSGNSGHSRPARVSRRWDRSASTAR